MQIKEYLALIILTLSSLTTLGQWKQQEFVIGTYLDPTLSASKNIKEDSLALVLAKDAGFNLLTGYRDDNYIKIDLSEEEVRYQLDLAVKVGLKVIVSDERFFYLKPIDNLKAEAVQKFYLNLDQKYRDAIMGYRLIDEPTVADSAIILPWVRFFNKIDPHKISYVNLLPTYGFETFEKYDEYLKIYLSASASSSNHVKVVSYDFYPFMENGTRSDYFYNLEQIRKYANGRPIWYYPNISKHLTYVEPKESHIKFESFCPLAYGATGLIYFSYESVPKQHPFNFAEALIDRQGKPTQKYHIVKKINKFIKQVAGPAIVNGSYLGTYHVSNTATFDKIAPNQILNPATPLISHVSNNNILVGIYQNKVDATKYHILMINKGLNPIHDIEVYFKGNGPKNLLSYSSNSVKDSLQSQSVGLTYLSKLDKTKATLGNIEGGGMVVLEATMPPIGSQGSIPSTINPSVNKLSINSFPNPVKDKTLIRFTTNKPGPVKVSLYNMLGQQIQSLVDEVKEFEGEYFINISTDTLAIGVYNCVLVTKEGKTSTKIIKIPG